MNPFTEDTMTPTEQGYVGPDSNNKSRAFLEWLHIEAHEVTNDWVDTIIHTMENRICKELQHIHIHSDSYLHHRPPIKSKTDFITCTSCSLGEYPNHLDHWLYMLLTCP